MIKSIIFDFGGVIIDLDYNSSFKAVSRLLGIQILRNAIPENLNSVFEAYERGMISEHTLIQNLETICGKKLDKKEFIDAWNAMLLGIPPQRLKFIEVLRKKYPVYLLSNTNGIHIDWVYQHLERDLNILKFENLFNKVFYSHKVHMRKPNRDIFEHVINDLNIIPAETLFIDDTQEHVDTAISLGISAVLHNPKTEIEEMIPFYLNRFKT